MGKLLSSIFTLENRRLLRKKDYSIYEAIKDQPELAPVSKKLATRSIVFSILSLLCVATIIITTLAFFGTLGTTGKFFTNVVVAILVDFISVIMFLIFYAKSIYAIQYQLKLNKCKRAKVALVLVIFPSIILVGGLIFTFILAKQNGAA